VFSSYATNLDPLHATFGPADVYVRALDLQTTVLVSLSTAGVKGDAESGYSSVAASFDGSSIAFTSSATNLVANDTNARTDIFVRDMAQATTTRISVATGGAQSMGTCTETAITADGRFVVFTSDATDLVPQPMAPLHARIYVHDRLTGETTLASRAHDGSAANGTCYGPSISDDGRRVAFVSGATNLVSGDTNGKADLFVHDRWTSATRLVSVTSGGTQANYRVDTGALSGDGRVAAFATLAWNIYPNDSNGGSDVFASFGPSAPVVYCQPKVNSLGCTPAIGSTGTPSASAPQAFVVTASNVLNQRTGLLFYGYAVNAAPFQGGTLCVLPPTRRTTLQTSGGSTSGDDCSGAYAFDINAHTQSSVDPNLTSGAVVCCQYCSRDPASPSTTGLTAGLLFEIQP
jgi:dipeptidyl aminopeptidase/acylaminoacyl peptidase